MNFQRTTIIRQLHWKLILVLTVLCTAQYTNAAEKSVTKSQSTNLLHGTVSQNELTDNLERLGIKCLIREGKSSSLVAEKVLTGSSAYYAGVLSGDIIKNLIQLNTNNFVLYAQRSGKAHQVNLSLIATQISKNIQVPKSIIINRDKLIEALTKKNKEEEKKLVPYQLDLLIDDSGSMGESDGTGTLSKFRWCEDQIHDLSQRMSTHHKTLNITLFNEKYKTYENCNTSDIEGYINETTPGGGTDLVDPLTDRFNNALSLYAKTKTHTLIIVITDGLPNIPNDPSVVKAALIGFSKQMTVPNEVTVAFLQIGDTFDGRGFCMDLDQNLVKDGAKYDMVNTRPFLKLKQDGLVSSLVDVVLETTENQNNSQLTKAEKNYQHSLKHSVNVSPSVSAAESVAAEQQKQRLEIEKQILGQ